MLYNTLFRSYICKNSNYLGENRRLSEIFALGCLILVIYARIMELVKKRQ